ncbi:hypothetical protein COO60DRAFT_1463558 [Scenedesmus sp. NREL 46B-D3]|nr:hypothetical protein COO60DRAFT_1463558 [Scenedesmus sp. NREL 46B-D3]
MAWAVTKEHQNEVLDQAILLIHSKVLTRIMTAGLPKLSERQQAFLSFAVMHNLADTLTPWSLDDSLSLRNIEILQTVIEYVKGLPEDNLGDFFKRVPAAQVNMWLKLSDEEMMQHLARMFLPDPDTLKISVLLYLGTGVYKLHQRFHKSTTMSQIALQIAQSQFPLSGAHMILGDWHLYDWRHASKKFIRLTDNMTLQQLKKLPEGKDVIVLRGKHMIECIATLVAAKTAQPEHR